MTTIDLTGKRFGRLLVSKCAGSFWSGKESKRHRLKWECTCDCGSTCVKWGEALHSGNSQSCGCLRNEVVKKANVTHGFTIGGKRLPEYSVWSNMKRRCYDPKNEKWPIYGGRGIKVCERWLNSFSDFFHDMGKRPDGMTLERKDTNGNYEPSNCCWATTKEQANNRRSNRVIERKGKSQTIQQWSEETGLGHTTIFYRLKRGLTTEQALTFPLGMRV